MTANLLANVGSKSTLTISPSKEHICAINPSNINVNYYIALHYCKLILLNQFDLTRQSLMLVTLSLNFKPVYFLINLSKMSILTAIFSLKLHIFILSDHFTHSNDGGRDEGYKSSVKPFALFPHFPGEPFCYPENSKALLYL